MAAECEKTKEEKRRREKSIVLPGAVKQQRQKCDAWRLAERALRPIDF